MSTRVLTASLKKKTFKAAGAKRQLAEGAAEDGGRRPSGTASASGGRAAAGAAALTTVRLSVPPEEDGPGSWAGCPYQASWCRP